MPIIAVVAVLGGLSLLIKTAGDASEQAGNASLKVAGMVALAGGAYYLYKRAN